MFELGVALRACGLERCGRRAVLDGLAHFTDRRTGLASCSDATLAAHTGLSERSIRRNVKALLDDLSLAGLVKVIERGQGRGRRSTYRVDLARVEFLGQAVMMAKRVIHAGASKALIDAKLTGAPLTPDNIRRAFKCLLRNLTHDRARKVRLAVMDLASQFEQFMAERAPAETPKKQPSAYAKRLARLRKGRGGVAERAVDKLCTTLGISRAKPAKMTGSYNKDNNPSGLSPLTPLSALTVRAEAVKQGRCVLAAADLVAFTAGWRGEREAFLAEFGIRTAEVNRNGVLSVFCESWQEATRLSDRWTDGLMRYAKQLELEGVAFVSEAV